MVQLSVRPTARAQQPAARRFSPFLLFEVDLLTVKRMMTQLALLTRQVRSSRPWAGEVPATRCHRTRPSTIQEKPPTYASLFSTIRCRKRNCKTSRDVQVTPTTLDIFNEQARPTLDPQSDAKHKWCFDVSVGEDAHIAQSTPRTSFVGQVTRLSLRSCQAAAFS